jgi:hypothetical protein
LWFSVVAPFLGQSGGVPYLPIRKYGVDHIKLSGIPREVVMLDQRSTMAASLALAAALTMAIAGAQAADDPRYPDWEGAWTRIPVKLPTQPSHDQTKPWGRGQQAPLTPEYQAILEASIADQAAGGLGNFPTTLGRAAGMPHMMMGFGPMEFVVTRKTTYILIGWYALPSNLHRRA